MAAGEKTARADLEKLGLVFNIAETQSFRDGLKNGGFYKDWRGRLGEEPFAILEQVLRPAGVMRRKARALSPSFTGRLWTRPGALPAPPFRSAPARSSLQGSRKARRTEGRTAPATCRMVNMGRNSSRRPPLASPSFRTDPQGEAERPPPGWRT